MAKISYLSFGSGSFAGTIAKMIQENYDPEEVGSTYAPEDVKAKDHVSGNLFEAVRLYTENSNRRCFLGETPMGYAVELDCDDGKTTQLVLLNRNADGFNIKAGVIRSDTPQAITGDYIMYNKATAPNGFKGTAVLLALMPEILKEAEAYDRYQDVAKYAADDDDSDYWTRQTIDEFGVALAKFTDNVYRRITDRGNGGARITLPEDQSGIMSMKMPDLKIKIRKAIVGKPVYFKAPVALKSGMTEYTLPVDYNDDEKKRVPTLDASYRLAEWTRDACKYIKKSTKYEEPIRTCFLVGPAGCGKTLGSVAMASLLGLVYDHITCQPDMEIFDFLGQIFPNTNPSKKMNFDDVRKQMDLPSVEDIMMDPESAYIKIFKAEMPSDTQEADIITAMVNTVNAEIAAMLNGKDYTYVEGGLTKAIRNGYLFEVQEIGIVKRAGVAVGLNALLESGKEAFITLPTGEQIKKHPSTVIVFTSNDEYEGTSNLNQSVLSRMGHVEYFKNASVDEMVKRTLSKVPDFVDKDLLRDMAAVVESISEFCQDRGITDGVCGQRELNNWAMEIMCDLEDYGLTEATDEIIRKACQHTVLNKVAQNVEDIQDVAEGCVNPLYGECAIRI